MSLRYTIPGGHSLVSSLSSQLEYWNGEIMDLNEEEFLNYFILQHNFPSLHIDGINRPPVKYL